MKFLRIFIILQILFTAREENVRKVLYVTLSENTPSIDDMKDETKMQEFKKKAHNAAADNQEGCPKGTAEDCLHWIRAMTENCRQHSRPVKVISMFISLSKHTFISSGECHCLYFAVFVLCMYGTYFQMHLTQTPKWNMRSKMMREMSFPVLCILT